jgi:hypothetical protein
LVGGLETLAAIMSLVSCAMRIGAVALLAMPEDPMASRRTRQSSGQTDGKIK